MGALVRGWLVSRVGSRKSVRALCLHLIRDDHGQDLVEYALLVMFFGIAFAAVWTGIASAVQGSYGNTRTGVQSLWDTPDPGGSSP
jgi:Flp pilus assembly pilin Flp